MLYLFAGYPRCGLNAGGLQHCVEAVENLGILEHDPAIVYAKEGVFVKHGSAGERIGPVEYRFSPRLEADGITWDWFYEHWGFGGGVSAHKTTANRETEVVDHRSGESLRDLMALGRAPLDLSKLLLQTVPKRTEGWEKYEARWKPGTCPQESHVVHVTWLATKHRLPSFAYERLRAIIEEPGTALRDVERYREKDFSPTRKWTVAPERPPELALPGGRL